MCLMCHGCGYGGLGMTICHPYSRGIYAERCRQLLLHATDYFRLAYSSYQPSYPMRLRFRGCGYGGLGMIIGHPYSRGIYAERCQHLLLHATESFRLAYSS